MASCDSGDIHPKKEVVTGRTIEASFVLEGVDAFPGGEDYILVFASFEERTEYPISFRNVGEPATAGAPVATNLSNISDQADYVALAVIDKSRKLVHTFYSHPIGGQGSTTITLPEQTVKLNGFGRVQQQLFSKCTTCHRNGAGARVYYLSLTPADSYARLVGVLSGKPGVDLMRAEAGNPDNSFIIKAMTERDALEQDHTEMVKPDDVNLLRSWITDGCLNN